MEVTKSLKQESRHFSDERFNIDGDDNAQIDLQAFEGLSNGMKRVSKVFRGQSFYSEIELINIYRSKWAEIADEL